MSNSFISPTPLKIYYQNVRGLRSKTDVVYNNTFSLGADVLLLTETWLSSDVSSGELFYSGYGVFRADRDFIRTNKAAGGGVLTCFCTNLNSCFVDTGTNSQFSPLIDVFI